ncbi:MAG: hypothetical protein M3N48_10380 [Verrucomicrobiota bacterium]|nr:hypothetical protein [Verrucomicrobiota bacterium]
MNGSPRRRLERHDKNSWPIPDQLLKFFRRNHGARLAKIAKDALDGLPHEKFLRLLGWFHTMVPPASKEKDPRGNYVDPVVRDFENIRVMIEEKCEQGDLRFQRDEMGDHVHNLNLILGKLVTAEALEVALPSIRDEFRMRVTPEAYAAYTGSPSYKALAGCQRPADAATKLRWLQADFIQLVNEIRKLTLLEYHIEETRTYLIKKLRRTLYKLLVAPAAIVLLFLIARVTTQLESFPTIFHVLVLATLLSLAAIAGAVGSFISALLRIAAVPETNEIGRSVVALRYSESIRLAPLTGFIFAILLSFIFGAQLLNGILFPKTDLSARWPDLLFSSPDLAKWIVWAFIVGFAERLMPDMIDRLVVKAGKTTDPAPASSATNGAKPHGGEPGANGANGNTPATLVRPVARRQRRARVRAA